MEEELDDINISMGRSKSVYEAVTDVINELGANFREYEIKQVNGQWRIIEKGGIVDRPLRLWLTDVINS